MNSIPVISKASLKDSHRIMECRPVQTKWFGPENIYALFGCEKKVEGKKVKGMIVEGMKVSRKLVESEVIV
jgi:hypothetical protein